MGWTPPFLHGILLISDNHAGHRHSLVAPGDDHRADPETPYGALQAKIWTAYLGLLGSAREFVRELTGTYPHRGIHLGDAIDGKGERSGGTEQLEMDRTKQAKLAVPLFEATGCDEWACVYGTGYHAGLTEDFEDLVVEGLRAVGMKAVIASQIHVHLDGLTIHGKHHVGGSSIPHGIHTASAREREMHLQWERDMGWPAAELTIRGHTHRCHDEGTPRVRSFVCPALIPPHTKYGGRRCFSPVDFGVTALVYGGRYGHLLQPFTATFEAYQPETVDWTDQPGGGE